MPERTLDDRFQELRQQVDAEISRSRSEVIAEMARAVSRMRAAASEPEWHEAVLDSGRVFANEPDALRLIGTLAALTAPVAFAPRTDNSEATEEATPVATPEPGGNAAVHASALRFARVKIAEMQLYQAGAVKAGRESHDLYGALKRHIDEAREAFHERFLTRGLETAASETTDYLHAEILHALANDDATLLGPDYPGPMA